MCHSRPVCQPAGARFGHFGTPCRPRRICQARRTSLSLFDYCLFCVAVGQPASFSSELGAAAVQGFVLHRVVWPCVDKKTRGGPDEFFDFIGRFSRSPRPICTSEDGSNNGLRYPQATSRLGSSRGSAFAKPSRDKTSTLHANKNCR